MLYSDAALYRIQRWLEDLDPRLRTPTALAGLTGLAEATTRRFLISGGAGNLNFETLRRLERQIPADFMPLTLRADLDPAEPASAT